MIESDRVYLPSGLVFDNFSKCNSVPTVKYYSWIIDEYEQKVFIHTWTWATIIRIKGNVCDLLLEDDGIQCMIYNVSDSELRTVDDFIKLWEE